MFEDQPFYNCKITLDSGKEYRISANWLHNQNLDHWQGWHCSAGKTRLMIDESFNVYSGECLNDYLGNLLSSWSPLENQTICNQKTCTGCTDDLIVKKHITGSTLDN